MSISQRMADDDALQGQDTDLQLASFYDKLLNRAFPDSSSAIDVCRELCAQYGFTVKQEASTHRNIYVYCSREGLPDSLRNPKANPQRKRPSKRCDCRWRVVLFESNGTWEFRKSLNPDASRHNHALMRPDEIEKSWPKEVTDMICELARQRLTTQDIRARIQTEFRDIHWNERRFYNRLSEERQKIKQRETASRARHLSTVWAKMCMVAAGSEELTNYVEEEVMKLFNAVCDVASVGTATLAATPVRFTTDEDSQAESSGSRRNSDTRQQHEHAQGQTSSHVDPPQSGTEPDLPSGTTSNISQKTPETPKGFIAVTIPAQSVLVKMHNQRTINDLQLSAPLQRTRSLSARDDAELDTDVPMPRKLSRKGTSKREIRAEQTRQLQPLRTSLTSASPSTHMVPPAADTAGLGPPVSMPFYPYDENAMALDSPMYIQTFPNTYSMSPTPFHNDMNFHFDSNLRNSSSSSHEQVLHPELPADSLAHKAQPSSPQTAQAPPLTPNTPLPPPGPSHAMLSNVHHPYLHQNQAPKPTQQHPLMAPGGGGASMLSQTGRPSSFHDHPNYYMRPRHDHQQQPYPSALYHPHHSPDTPPTNRDSAALAGQVDQREHGPSRQGSIGGHTL